MEDNQASNPGPMFLDETGGSASPSGGPKFGRPKSVKNRSKKIGPWLKKHSSSIILPLVALCILIAGIYLYKNWPSETKSPIEKQIAGLSEKIETPAATEETVIAPLNETNEPVSESIEEIIATEEGRIVVQAKKGEGITHLARQTLKVYLGDKSELANQLTKEHKIYIEDYLKDKKVAEREGNKIVEIDEVISFEQELINEAINKSQELKPEELKNLEKYSTLVPSL